MIAQHFKPNQETVKSNISGIASLDSVDELCQELGLDNYNIFTDGSWKDMSSNIEKMFFKQSSSKSSCSVCLISTDDEWKEKPMILVEIKDSPENPVTCAFPMELLAAALALKLKKRYSKTEKIYTDCESIVKMTAKKQSLKKIANKDNLALISGLMADYNSIGDDKIFEHVKAHVERRKDVVDWTSKEFGNVIADRTAVGDDYFINQHCLQVSKLSMTVAQALELISEEQQLYVSNEHGMHLTTMRKAFNAQTANAYTTYRDQHHKVGNWSTWDWLDIDWMFTSKVYHFDECTHLERSSQVRIIFNKLWQQWNIFRFDNNKHPEITDKCRLCGQVDSMLHLIIECKCGGMLDIWRDGRLALQTIMSEIGENKLKS